jgi:transmembrane sensor
VSDDAWPERDKPTAIMDEGAAWIVEIIGDPSDANLDACKSWYETSEEHRKAFASAMFFSPMPTEIRNRIEATLGEKFETIEQAASGNVTRPQDAAGEARLQPWGARRPHLGRQSARKGRRRRLWIGVAAAASVAVVSLGLGVLPDSMSGLIVGRAEAHRFETGHAEIRSFSLSDGSSITLDSDTRVDVTIDRSERRALVRQGRVRFVVKPDARPFSIEAEHGKIVSARGTIDVEVDGARGADIRLRAGAATVQAGSKTEPLVIGQPVTYAVNDATPTSVAAPSTDTREWPTGWVEYRTVPLGTLIEQANRYAKVPIVLDDPTLAALQASGRFKLTDTEQFVSHIAEPFGLRVSRRADAIHLSR